MGVIFLLSAQPSLDSGLGAIDLIGRKLVHFAEYALLCFLWWRAFATMTNPRRAALAAFLVASGYAATDELHQALVEGRAGQFFEDGGAAYPEPASWPPYLAAEAHLYYVNRFPSDLHPVGTPNVNFLTFLRAALAGHVAVA